MKVLVIDDDPTTHKVMEVFLRKSGYVPVMFNDAVKGLAEALKPDAPMILVLDWMMPGLDGPVLCKRLRDARQTRRPYVFFLSGRNKKEEIAAGLDAGADDFVTKPFNILEMQARLRVARRNVEHQLELLRMAEELAAMRSRNEILGEIMSGHAPMPALAAVPVSKETSQVVANSAPTAVQAESAPETPVSAPTGVSGEKADGKKPSEPDISQLFVLGGQEVRYVLASALIEMRLALQASTASEFEIPIGEGNCCALGSMHTGAGNVWIDALFATKEESASAMFETALRRKPKGREELTAFLAEVARVISRRVAQMLAGAGASVSQHLEPKAKLLGAGVALPTMPSARQAYILKVDGMAAKFLIVRQYCAARRVEVEALREGDVLAEPFPRREVSELPIFNEGVALTPRFLEKLNFHVEKSQVGADVEVFRPSPLANFFLRE